MLVHFTSNGSVNTSGWAASNTNITESPDTTLTEMPDITMQPDKERILVYPNPVMDYVTIEISNNLEISKIEIIDLYGRILSTTGYINSTSVNLKRGDLQTGIYILRIHAVNIYSKNIFIRKTRIIVA